MANRIKKIQQELSNSEIIDYRKQHLNPTYKVHFQDQNGLHIIKGEGTFLYTNKGEQYLDCINNVPQIGHSNQEVNEAVYEQMKLLNTNTRFLHQKIIEYTNNLLKTLPPELCNVTFTNSGSESNDLALVMAKHYAQSEIMICSDAAYHGHSDSCLKVSPYKWNKQLKGHQDTIVIDSPCTYRGKYSSVKEGQGILYAQDLLQKIAGFISEPIQSCAGQVVPSYDYFEEIYKVIKSKGGVTIMDEVQTGFGRLGEKFWGFQIYDVIPDIITFGKPAGNGFTVAGVVCNQKIADSFKQRNVQYFNTFGGNPVSCVAGNKTLEIIQRDKLQENALFVGNYMLSQLKKLVERYEFIGDVRGMGLFQGKSLEYYFNQGIEFINKDKSPFTQMAVEVVQLCMKKYKVILNTDGIHDNMLFNDKLQIRFLLLFFSQFTSHIIKIKPPIIFTVQNVDQMVLAIDLSIQEFMKINQFQEKL